jgi:hypothetical protein
MPKAASSTAKPAKAKPPKPALFKGGCLCGHIRFEATGPAQKPHSCSCRMCQRHTGSLTTIWIEFPKDHVRWVGPGGAPSTWVSSKITARAFCPQCGSTLGAIDTAATIGLLSGVFDNPSKPDLVPKYHTYRAARPQWWCVEIKPDEN